MLPLFPCGIGGRDSALGIEAKCCGDEKGKGSLGKWIICHFCPFCFDFKHILETKMLVR